MEFEIVSHGGIGTPDGPNLTGSCHELIVRYGKTVYSQLVDTGGFQGANVPDRKTEDLMRRAIAVYQTHPHFDHIADTPRAFSGGGELDAPIFSTDDTADAAFISWEDSAKISMKDYEAKRRQSDEKVRKISNALQTLEQYESRGDGVPQVARSTDGSGNRMERTHDAPPATRYRQAIQTLEEYGIDRNDANWKKRFEVPPPPYDLTAVERAFDHITTHEISDGWKDVVPGKIAFRFYDAGHIIGSTSVLFRIYDDLHGDYKHVLFSGDVGSYKWDIHPCGVPVPPADVPIDVAVIESTYRDRVRKDFEKGRDEFETGLVERTKTHRRVFESCFSLDRLQNILYRTVKLKAEGKIDKNVKIYVDSPSGVKHLRNYVFSARRRLSELSLPEADAIRHALGSDYLERERKNLEDFIEYLDPSHGYYEIISTEEDREFHKNDRNERKIVVTASGMANGGPIVSYLKSFGGDSQSAFLFPGYMAKGTVGRKLLNVTGTRMEDDGPDVRTDVPEHERFVEIEDANVLIRAKIESYRFLSGHADAEDNLTYLESLKLAPNQKIVLIHGDDGAQADLAAFLYDYGYYPESLVIPELGERLIFRGSELVRKKVARKVRETVRESVPRKPRNVPARTNEQGGGKPSRTPDSNGEAPIAPGASGSKKEAGDAISEAKRAKTIAAKARELLGAYELRLQSMFSEAHSKVGLVGAKFLLDGLELVRSIRKDEAEIGRLENEIEGMSKLLRKTSVERRHPHDRRRAKRHERRSGQMATGEESDGILTTLRERAHAMRESVIQKNRMVSEIFAGLRTSDDVKWFVQTGQRPLRGIDRPGKAERIQDAIKKLERDLAEARQLEAKAENDVERIKNAIARLEERERAERSAVESLNRILSYVPEHLESQISALRKRMFQIGKELRERGSSDGAISIATAPLGDGIAEMERLLSDRDALLSGLSPLLREEFGSDEQKRVYVSGKGGDSTLHWARRDLQRHQSRAFEFGKNRERRTLELDEARGRRKTYEQRVAELRSRLENPDTLDISESDWDSELPTIDETAVQYGIRMAVDDTIRSLEGYKPIRAAMDQIRYCARDAEENRGDPLKSFENLLVIHRMDKNGELFETLEMEMRQMLEMEEGRE